MSAPLFSAADKLKEIEREIAMRKRVYANWIQSRRMSQEKADRQIAIMEAVRDDIKKLADAERLL